MVKKKDKGTTVSSASRTIIAEGVHIENSVFVDEEGNIAEKTMDLLIDPKDTFKLTIKVDLPEDEVQAN